jgi:DNA mismatch endonuclease, patch repair protein
MSTPASTSRRMSRVRQRDTSAEMALRRELHRRNLRYRVNYTVLAKPRRVADVVFPRLKIAVFVDGCFWHGCPEHASWPKSNAEFWREKIEANRARDADTNVRLTEAGWRVIRVWEHANPGDAADEIFELVKSRRSILEKKR